MKIVLHHDGNPLLLRRYEALVLVQTSALPTPFHARKTTGVGVVYCLKQCGLVPR
jgi:hypothetical protein